MNDEELRKFIDEKLDEIDNDTRFHVLHPEGGIFYATKRQIILSQIMEKLLAEQNIVDDVNRKLWEMYRRYKPDITRYFAAQGNR